MSKNNSKKNKKASSNSSNFAEYYFAQLGVFVLFMLVATFLFDEKVDILPIVVVIISFFAILPIIVFIVRKTVNIILQYFKNKK